ncbi:MAG: NAD-dependent epimerase/dehydratase family protein [Tannerellaceae bacterium]
MRILITGASGFIGGFLVQEALNRGYDVWAGVRARSNTSNLQDNRIHFIDLKYGDINALTDQLKEFNAQYGAFDYVIHNAGLTKSLHVADFDRVNYQYTRNLIDALRASGSIPKKFVLMSSLSSFGLGDEEHYTPFQRSDKPNPNTAYGQSKLKAEEYLESLTDFPYMILRPTGVYGPGEKDYFLNVKAVKSGIEVGLGFRPQQITFIYVTDLVKAAFLALESPLRNKAYFVADGDVYTDAEYSAMLKELLGKKHSLKLRLPLWVGKVACFASEQVGKLTGNVPTLNLDKYKILKQRNWKCDIEPLRKELGFEPEYPLRRGLEACIKWYKEAGWL